MKYFVMQNIIAEKLSLLSWERGLKYVVDGKKMVRTIVAPLVGAWIEII